MPSEAAISDTDGSHAHPSDSPAGTKHVESNIPQGTQASDGVSPRKPSNDWTLEDATEARKGSLSDVDPAASQGEPSDPYVNLTAYVVPCTPKHSPPIASAEIPETESSKPVQSDEKDPASRLSAPQPEQPPESLATESIKYGRNEITHGEHDTISNESSLLSQSHENIEDFDWDDLQCRYHDKMRELSDNELAIFAEFNGLCDYFGIWASALQTHEVGRSFKRLKTQMAYVRHEEDELEQKRDHYIKVVEAFRNALQLLGN